jgi:hypothetical protein
VGGLSELGELCELGLMERSGERGVGEGLWGCSECREEREGWNVLEMLEVAFM